MKVLIVSDIHANLVALMAVLAAEADADKIVCLGDLVDYGPQPTQCIALMRNLTEIVLQGNHDYAVGENADPRCSEPYRHLAQVTQKYTMSALRSEERAYLSELPTEAYLDFDGSRVTAVHAAPSDPLFQYRPPETPMEAWEAEIVLAGNPDLLLLGHTHLPFMQKVRSTTIMNPGSVGQPKHGSPDAAYAVWQDGELSLRRAVYDVWRTADAFNDTDLHPGDVARLIAILRSGGSEGP